MISRDANLTYTYIDVVVFELEMPLNDIILKFIDLYKNIMTIIELRLATYLCCQIS